MTEDPRIRLTILIKYITGDSIDLINHCIQQPIAEGYENAMRLLKRYREQVIGKLLKRN